ncbi:MAG: hypothetical protein J3Q66DRAFT_325852, partial [Benniella sp.]
MTDLFVVAAIWCWFAPCGLFARQVWLLSTCGGAATDAVSGYQEGEGHGSCLPITPLYTSLPSSHVSSFLTSLLLLPTCM